jgi:hypothetical protein
MIQTPRITYRARDDATPESEVSVLAAVYKIILAKKEAAPESRPDDTRERSQNDSSARTIIPEE